MTIPDIVLAYGAVLETETRESKINTDGVFARI
jgi:hypothetical protein